MMGPMSGPLTRSLKHPVSSPMISPVISGVRAPCSTWIHDLPINLNRLLMGQINKQIMPSKVTRLFIRFCISLPMAQFMLVIMEIGWALGCA